MSRQLAGSGPPLRAVLRVPLPLLTWGLCFISGLAATLRDDNSTTGLVFLLTVPAVVAVLVAAVVWLWLPGPREGPPGPAVAFLGVLLGAFLGAVSAFLFVMGVFLPYLAGWGRWELEDFGGNDFAPGYWLKSLILSFSLIGAIVCGASGFIAWALRFLRPDRWG
jgi:hypothetical protein